MQQKYNYLTKEYNKLIIKKKIEVKTNTFVIDTYNMTLFSDYYTIPQNLTNQIVFQIHRKQNNVYFISEISDNIKREKNYFVLQSLITGKYSYKLNIGNEIKIGKLNLRVRKIHTSDNNINNNKNNNNSPHKNSEIKTISNILLHEKEKKGTILNKSVFNTSEREPFNDESCENDIESGNKCRICLEGEANINMASYLNLNQTEKNEKVFISPCNCKGDHKYVHLSCLKKWLKSRYGSQSLNNPNSMIYSFPNKCEICQGILPDVVEAKDNFYDLSDFVEINFDNYIVFEILSDNIECNEKTFLILKLIKNNYCFIGKGDHNHYIFSDQDMSEHHCRLFLDNNGNVFLSDFNSETGTFVKIEGAIQLIEKNLMFLQNKNTFIKLELSSEKNCCLCPSTPLNYPEIYFKNNNFNLDIRKIFRIKEKEKTEKIESKNDDNINKCSTNNENNDKNNNNKSINDNNKNINTFSTLISSSNCNSTSNIISESNTNNFDSIDNKYKDNKLINVQEKPYTETNEGIKNDNSENINPNFSLTKKDSKMYLISEHDVISNNSINDNNTDEKNYKNGNSLYL